jgi:hypothetical protein
MKGDIKMKVAKEFEYTMVEEIYSLCNRENYFTCGSNHQYDLMFSMAKMPEISTRDLAMMIFTCSDGASLGRILSDLNSIMNKIEDYERELEEERHSYQEIECLA